MQAYIRYRVITYEHLNNNKVLEPNVQDHMILLLLLLVMMRVSEEGAINTENYRRYKNYYYDIIVYIHFYFQALNKAPNVLNRPLDRMAI
jgi:hypothetical protein